MTTSIDIIKSIGIAILVVAALISTLYIAYIMIPILLLVGITGIIYFFINNKSDNNETTTNTNFFDSLRY